MIIGIVWCGRELENKVHGCVSTLSLIQSCFKGLLSLNILVLFDETKCTMIVPFPGNLMCPVFMCFLNDILLSRWLEWPAKWLSNSICWKVSFSTSESKILLQSCKLPLVTDTWYFDDLTRKSAFVEDSVHLPYYMDFLVQTCTEFVNFLFNSRFTRASIGWRSEFFLTSRSTRSWDGAKYLSDGTLVPPTMKYCFMRTCIVKSGSLANFSLHVHFSNFVPSWENIEIYNVLFWEPVCSQLFLGLKLHILLPHIFMYYILLRYAAGW